MRFITYLAEYGEEFESVTTMADSMSDTSKRDAVGGANLLENRAKHDSKETDTDTYEPPEQMNSESEYPGT